VRIVGELDHLIIVSHDVDLRHRTEEFLKVGGVVACDVREELSAEHGPLGYLQAASPCPRGHAGGEGTSVLANPISPSRQILDKGGYPVFEGLERRSVGNESPNAC
jgi:hypothetical protein